MTVTTKEPFSHNQHDPREGKQTNSFSHRDPLRGEGGRSGWVGVFIRACAY